MADLFSAEQLGRACTAAGRKLIEGSEDHGLDCAAVSAWFPVCALQVPSDPASFADAVIQVGMHGCACKAVHSCILGTPSLLYAFQLACGSCVIYARVPVHVHVLGKGINANC